MLQKYLQGVYWSYERKESYQGQEDRAYLGAIITGLYRFRNWHDF